MSKQLDHYEFKKIQKKFSPNIVLVLENFEHEENIGSAFRLADAFNVKKYLLFRIKNWTHIKLKRRREIVLKQQLMRFCQQQNKLS